MTRSIARTVYQGAVWLFVGCVVVQVFLAGLGVFDDQRAFVTHREFGYLFGWLVLVMLVAAIVGRMGRRHIGGSILLMVLFSLQSLFVAVRTDMPQVAALHPLNGVLILLTAVVLGRWAWLVRRATSAARTSADVVRAVAAPQSD